MIQPVKLLPVYYADRLTPERCRKHTGMLYVFGDNAARVGRKGQAVIRGERNAFGIATKRRPCMSPGCFFHDTDNDVSTVVKDITILASIMRGTAGPYYKQFQAIVWPEAGIGTGLAKMNIYSPNLFSLMNKWLNLLGIINQRKSQ